MKVTLNSIFVIAASLFGQIAPACAQGLQIEKQQLIKQRMSKIDRYHVSVGLGGEFSKSQRYYVQIFTGYGSMRNLLNIDVGLRYMSTNPITRNGFDDVSLAHAAVFAAGDINFFRSKGWCSYGGAEIAWNAATSGKYYYETTKSTHSDLSLGSSYGSMRLRLGAKMSERWRIEVYYAYDFAPAFDQKYIFESTQYDYDAVYDRIYDRGHFGLTLAYQLNF